MCNAARAELLLPHAPEIPIADSPLEAWSQAAERTLWVMFGDRYEEITTNHEATEVHQRAVAGLACAMVSMMDMGDEDRRVGVGITIAGRFHDLGKGREEIRALLDLKTKFNPEQRKTMDAHARYGAQDFAAFAAENMPDPSLEGNTTLFELVRYAIRSHHEYGGRLRSVSFDVDTRKLRVAVAVLQAADMTQAMLTTTGRAYRMQRLVEEGLATVRSQFGGEDVLVPDTDAIARHIGAEIGINSLGHLARSGATMRDLVALGVELMSDSDPDPASNTFARGGQVARRWRIPRYVPRLVGSLDR